MVNEDPAVTNTEHYTVLWENDLVRVLEYSDQPGDATSFHAHPDSVMVTLSGFQRRLFVSDNETIVDLPAGKAVWLRRSVTPAKTSEPRRRTPYSSSSNIRSPHPTTKYWDQ